MVAESGSWLGSEISPQDIEKNYLITHTTWPHNNGESICRERKTCSNEENCLSSKQHTRFEWAIATYGVRRMECDIHWKTRMYRSRQRLLYVKCLHHGVIVLRLR